MHIKILDIIDNKNLFNIIDLNKNLSVIPSLFLDNKCLNFGTNSNLSKHKYSFVKPDKDNDCIDDEIYKKLFDTIETYTKKEKINSKNNIKSTRRAKKTIKERISRKEKKPKIKTH